MKTVYTPYAVTVSAASGGPPSSPSTGDIWIASNVDSNGTRWQFQYNAGSSSAYKWEFIGGAPMYGHYDYPGGQTMTASTYTAAPNIALTVPRAGDYLFYGEIDINNSTAGSAEYIGGLSQNSTTTLLSGGDGAAYMGFPTFTGTHANISGQYRMTGAAANDVFRILGWCNGTGSLQISFAKLSCIPVRVS